jgi:hypothetical protein
MAQFLFLLCFVFILPLLMTMFSWHFTGDARKCWQQKPEEVLQLARLTLPFSAAVIGGAVFYGFSFYAVVHYWMLMHEMIEPSQLEVQRTLFQLYCLVLSLPIAVLFTVWGYRQWFGVRQFFGIGLENRSKPENS